MTTTQAEPAATLRVRIHPQNPQRGYTHSQYLVHGTGLHFRESAGWYKVDARIARDLAKVRNNPNDPMSPPVFQVASEEQATALDAKERVRAARARQAIPASVDPEENRKAVPRPVRIPAEAVAKATPVKAATVTVPAPKQRSLAPVEEPAAPEEDDEDEAPVASVEDDFDLDLDEELGAESPDLTTADLNPPPEKPRRHAPTVGTTKKPAPPKKK